MNQITLMLVLPLPVYRTASESRIDRQALNGLHRWLDNFDRLVLCVPERPLATAPTDTSLLDEAAFGDRLRVVYLPSTYRPLPFLSVLPATGAVLDSVIDQSTHLCFAIGGLFGDWGAVAVLRAARKGRRASVWTDRVEHIVVAFTAQHARGFRKYFLRLTAWAMKHYERLVIRRAAVGLFHGAECYEHYARFSPHPHLVHNIHLKRDEHIRPADLARKRLRDSEAVLSIVYVGRVHADKGVEDWIDTLRIAKQAGLKFRASWYGEGPLFNWAVNCIQKVDLAAEVSFPGLLNDRTTLMQHLRDADIFLFCHKTPESPRCLIEALVSGTPLVGYGSAYPTDLITSQGGGVLTKHDPAVLAEALLHLARDRQALTQMFAAAAASGASYTDEEVFAHRSDIIKEFT